jgi:hypothetical protein
VQHAVKGSHLPRRLLALLAVMLVALGASVAAFAGSGKTASAQGEQPKFTTEGSAPFGFRTSNTVPYWSSSFTFDGKIYPYTMVGTAPTTDLGTSSTGQVGGTTTVPTVLIPVTFRFSADAQKLAQQILPGCTFDSSHNVIPGSCVAVDATMDANDVVQGTADSPIFANSDYTGVQTLDGDQASPDTDVQYGDAIQRAEFDVFGTWHTRLGNPAIEPTTVIDVPASKGVAFVNRRDVLTARIDYHWFSNKLNELINQFHVQATELPIILTHDVYLYQVDINNCCVLGYHGVYSTRSGNGAQAVQTYIYSAWATPGSFTSPEIADIHALSHEVSEWMNDPFLWNLTPDWFAPGYGCDDFLETGDPVVGVAFHQTVNGYTYHPEDEVFLSWFARQDPSIAYGGHYTFLNYFDSPSSGCPS